MQIKVPRFFTKQRLLILAAVLEVSSLFFLGGLFAHFSADTLDKKIERSIEENTWRSRQNTWKEYENGLDMLELSVRQDQIANDDDSFFRNLIHTQTLQSHLIDGFSAAVGLPDSTRVNLKNNLHSFWVTRLEADDTFDMDDFFETLAEQPFFRETQLQDDFALLVRLLMLSDHAYYESASLVKLRKQLSELKLQWEHENKEFEIHIETQKAVEQSLGSYSLLLLWLGVFLQIGALLSLVARDFVRERNN